MTSTEPIDPDVEEVPEPGAGDDDDGDQGDEDADDDAEPYGP